MMGFVKKYSNRQGSVFVLVLMIMTVLMILGSALLFAVTANYAMNASYIRGNGSFYKADGWIERVNNLLEEQTVLVQKKAKGYIESHKDEIVEAVYLLYTNRITGELTIDEQELAKKIEEQLLKEYKDAFNKYVTGETGYELKDSNSLRNILEAEFNSWMADPMGDLEEIVIQSFPVYPGSDHVDGSLKMKVQVVSDPHDIEKKIQAEFEFLKKQEQIPIKKSLVRRKNPIWMRAITTESSLVALQGEVTVQGDGGADTTVYAYGNLADDNSSGYKYGGVVAGIEPTITGSEGVLYGITDEIPVPADGKLSGKLTVTGDVKTRANIHTAYGSDAEGSNINITGNAYCQSVQIDTAGDNSTIDIDGDVYAFNDLSVYGSNSELDVNGNFYGFMQGGYNSYEYNKSSGIILNDTSSIIRVLGDVFIGGKIYVEYIFTIWNDGSKDIRVPYKTGESVSIGQNYNAYRFILNDSLIDEGFKNIVGDNPEDFNPNKWSPIKMYWGMDSIDPVNREAEQPNSDNNTRTAHFATGYSTHNDFRNIINKSGVILGTNTLLNIYAPGIIFTDGYVITKGGNGIGAKAIDAAGNETYTDPDNNLTITSMDGTTKVVHLYQEDEFSGENWEKTFNKSTWIQQDKDDSRYKDIGTDSEFSELVASTIGDSGVYDNLSDTGEELYYVDTMNAPVHLDGSDIDGRRGIIFTIGDLYISSDSNIEFTGAIVSKGNIVFYGDGEKTITYDEETVKTVTNRDSTLRDFFHKGNSILDLQASDIEIGIQATRNIKLVDWKEVN
ncbi:hypothetical protein [Petroclostridium sp. X23]|uniref:hypothetical protein n=1 Tax=Petroclostridium sp. X23 TaxID=3045146 RepID=UPI0024ADBDC3|nr:hypothetical protein [Petroclostridium sp. X23]WHH59657.1 hypothetical protein QKW49_02530 [Petroclostridium sp. X23]